MIQDTHEVLPKGLDCSNFENFLEKEKSFSESFSSRDYELERKRPCCVQADLFLL